MCYDDGEVGMHRLWQHDERIRLASPVEQVGPRGVGGRAVVSGEGTALLHMYHMAEYGTCNI